MTGRGVAMRATTHWTEVGGLRLYSRSLGHGTAEATPLVCIHGAVIAGAYLLPLAARLARDRRVLVPDLPGYGRSDHPVRVLSVAGLAEALVAWLDANELARVALLGHSLGAQVVAHAAAAHPSRVERLVLLAPTVDPRARTARAQLWRLVRDVPHERRSLVALELRDLRRCGLRRAVATVRIALADRIETVLPHIEAPALVVRGERDPLVPRRWAREVAQLLPHARAVEIAGGSHAVNHSRPRAVAEIVRPFLQRETAAASGDAAA